MPCGEARFVLYPAMPLSKTRRCRCLADWRKPGAGGDDGHEAVPGTAQKRESAKTRPDSTEGRLPQRRCMRASASSSLPPEPRPI